MVGCNSTEMSAKTTWIVYIDETPTGIFNDFFIAEAHAREMRKHASGKVLLLERYVTPYNRLGIVKELLF